MTIHLWTHSNVAPGLLSGGTPAPFENLRTTLGSDRFEQSCVYVTVLREDSAPIGVVGLTPSRSIFGTSSHLTAAIIAAAQPKEVRVQTGGKLRNFPGATDIDLIVLAEEPLQRATYRQNQVLVRNQPRRNHQQPFIEMGNVLRGCVTEGLHHAQGLLSYGGLPITPSTFYDYFHRLIQASSAIHAGTPFKDFEWYPHLSSGIGLFFDDVIATNKVPPHYYTAQGAEELAKIKSFLPDFTQCKRKLRAEEYDLLVDFFHAVRTEIENPPHEVKNRIDLIFYGQSQ